MFNKLINDNWQELFNQLKPNMERSSEVMMMKVVKKSEHMLPYSEVFPDLFETENKTASVWSQFYSCCYDSTQISIQI